ncbi:MFS transporter [Spelaeicoccus albus]|uniref:ACS family glucarate transporter-like MFS transporter n=1 Tax=Spelaeicoccus albus TaxID=1280376 RepID=A0A7Z0D0A1_9MICO|nr:MFS transporter [Spelaeicoccus albus]NYI67104.1 ACS family glucarate transporter-like MFS transporter [Spelaeicoccus albus]
MTSKKTRPSKIRWVMVSLAFIAIATNYIDRANLSVALPYMDKELHISAGITGLILGAFFWTYTAFQVPAGHFVDKLGARVTFAGAVMWWSIFTAATVLARGTASLFGFRLLLGVGEAAAFPAATKMVERWFPARERGLASGIYDSGARGGTIVAIPLVTAIIAALGWRASFLITAAIGMLWVVAWMIFAKEFPEQHKLVNAQEVAHIREDDDQGDPGDANRIPWKSLLRSRTVWGLGLGFACQAYVIYFFITWFPSYLVDARGFDLLELGIFGAIPGLAGFVGSWFGGWFSDKLAASRYTLNTARKSSIVIGMALSSLVGLAGVAPHAWMALTLLSISFFGVSFATASILAVPADISPKGEGSVTGSVAGFQNAVSNLAGIVSPAAIGFLKDATGSFTPGLLSAAAVALGGCAVYIFMVGRIEPGSLRLNSQPTDVDHHLA